MDAYCDDDLSDEGLRAQIEEHLLCCPSCARAYRKHADFLKELQNLSLDVDLPPRFHDEWMQKITAFNAAIADIKVGTETVAIADMDAETKNDRQKQQEKPFSHARGFIGCGPACIGGGWNCCGASCRLI